MRKSKRSKRRDQLSELPDSLILHILSFLPMRDVVRTTLLSKRWKDLWTTVPCLNFKGYWSSKEGINGFVRFQNFVNRALTLWKGTKILKFDIVSYHERSASSDLDLWLRVALENEVEELYVHLNYIYVRCDADYWAPERLYSCSSIRKLSLKNCNLKINGNVQWDQLKCLTIDRIFLSEEAMNQVLSGAPQLEVLILNLIENHENLNIQSSSLKKLSIDKSNLGDDDEGPMDTVLRIWVPNVETLEISGAMYRNYLLMNVSSLTEATVCIYGPRCEGNDKASWYAFDLEILMPVFHSIHHVEKVTLSDWCVEVLGTMKHLLSPLSDAKSLKLDGYEANNILDVLEFYPKVTTLVLEHPNLWVYKKEDIVQPFVLKFDEENPLKSKTNFLPKAALLHLRTVEIAWNARDSSIYPFIEFILKHSCKLEKMVFQVAGMSGLARESLLLAAQKLLGMPRSSPTAEVIFRKY